MVAMDDFFYSEPVPGPAASTVTGLAALDLLLRRRRA